MMGRARVFWAMIIILLIYPNDNIGGAYQPEFVAPIANLTVPLGRDAMFTCLVEHLGGYRVGWIKADTKAIQAIHDHVITHNQRVSVSRSDHSMWNLHIKGVQLEDAGLYMCQINTDPMKSQTGMLSIEVPPDFVADETSGDVMIGEGGQVKLICRAKGVPQPRVTWRREDGKDITIRESVTMSNGQKSKITTISEHHGEELRLTKISRHDMGAYLCIASNGVPPAISKRITINVHFPPVIHVPNQLVGAPLGTDVALECFVEASPKSINYWMKDNEAMIITGARHDVQAVFKSAFQVRMLLNIRNLQKQDFGSYCCVAKNSLGSVDISIRLYEISGPSGANSVPLPPYYENHDGDDETVLFGSAELDKMDNKAYSVDNTVRGHVGGSSPSRASSPSPTMKINRRRPTPLTNSSSTSCAVAYGGITFFYQCHNINLIAIVFIMIRSLTHP